MNVVTKTLLKAKLEHYNLNMYYPCGFTLEAESNFYIQQKIKEFLNQYKDLTETHTFVLEYHDDILSLICYRMLKVISSFSSFNLVIYGKVKRTKEMIKDVKKIHSIKLKRLIKQNKIIYISPFNPLYKVAFSKDNFKKFNIPIWYPIQNFTPAQLEAIRLFYHIGYIKNDIIEDKIVKNNLQYWCENSQICENNAWRDININLDNSPYKNDIIVLNLTSSIEKNKLLLQEIENTNSIVLYHLPEDINKNTYDQIVMQLKQFSLYIKRHTNAYGYLNILNEMDITINDYQEFFNCNIIYEGEEK